MYTYFIVYFLSSLLFLGEQYAGLHYLDWGVGGVKPTMPARRMLPPLVPQPAPQPCPPEWADRGAWK